MMTQKKQLLPYLNTNKVEAGCDEAGRGCIAGPVFAAAVILPSDFCEPLLDDSKKLSLKNRELLRKIIEKESIAFHVSQIDNHEIDRLNILKASIIAMHKSIKNLAVQPEHLLIDGNRFYPYENIPHSCIIKGDGKYLSIAAASVLAKTYRDEFMLKLHHECPEYHWNNNKGYPTKKHREAVEIHGISKYHRRSFSLLNTQLKLNFK